MFALMLFANFILIHIPGLIQLNLWVSLVKGTNLGLWETLMMGTIPFIAGDVTKIAAAAAVTTGVTPKKAFNGEVDVEKMKNWRIP
jgi:biotin transport system substrate-specific component